MKCIICGTDVTNCNYCPTCGSVIQYPQNQIPNNQMPSNRIVQYYYDQPQQEMNNQQINNQINQPVICPEVKIAYIVSQIIGIVGSLICIISTFLPFYMHRNITYNMYTVSFIGWTVLIASTVSLLSCILIKNDYGIIRYLCCGPMCLFNFIVGVFKLYHVNELCIGHFLLYLGIFIIFVSSCIMLYVCIMNRKIKKIKGSY